MQLEGEMYPDVRPRRQTHRPTHYEEYEVEYLGYQLRDLSPYTQRVVYQPREEPGLPSHYLTQTSPGSRRGDAAHPETPQLAPDCSQRRDLYTEEHAPSHLQSTYSASHFQAEIRAMQEESIKLTQARQDFQSGIADLDRARSEIKELVEVTRLLRAEISQSNAPPTHNSTHEPLQRSAPATVCDSAEEQHEEEDDEEKERPYHPPHTSRNESLRLHNMRLEASDPAYGHPLYAPKYMYTSHPPMYSPHKPPLFTQRPLQSPAPAPYSRTVSSPVQVKPPLLPRPPAYPAQPLSRPSPAYTGRTYPAPTPAQHPWSAFRAVPSLQSPNPPLQSSVTEHAYRGPRPTIPKFCHPDPSEFARLRIALENLLPPDATELFSYQILVDHLKLDEAKLIADAYLNS
ncbi:hypothetical protein N1851_023832 [Merluccius polli]|uniref:Uncharacterized protein n=1 Tax=Merluccius polli TaxID=89951 RepID=A0AA47MG32_MERPO|nr:hypothetical protein N1851_023832 [Merluccius polli]